MESALYSLEFTSIEGKPLPMAGFAGRVILVVNVASECGFTSQYAGLEKLWQEYRDRGLVVIGFPCNQFGGQEPGDEAQISSFCQRNYGVSFPLSKKIEVNGVGAHPIFKFLTERAPGLMGTKAIKWNFTKFLVSRDGRTVERFAPTTAPADLAAKIGVLLDSAGA